MNRTNCGWTESESIAGMWTSIGLAFSSIFSIVHNLVILARRHYQKKKCWVNSINHFWRMPSKYIRLIVECVDGRCNVGKGSEPCSEISYFLQFYFIHGSRHILPSTQIISQSNMHFLLYFWAQKSLTSFSPPCDAPASNSFSISPWSADGGRGDRWWTGLEVDSKLQPSLAAICLIRRQGRWSAYWTLSVSYYCMRMA